MDAAPSSHPTRKVLSSFGLGKLDDRSAQAVSKHLDQCPNCRKQVAEMSADSFLGRLRDAQGPAMSTYGQSRTAGGTFGQMSPMVVAPPLSHTLPPGLADHPDYEIKRELGRGGMGVVYLAHHRLMGRDEVLKVMGRHIMERPGVLDRFMREIRAVAKLRHPNIVTAYHAFRLGDSFVFAMEYVEGLDLSRMVKAKGPLPVGHACNFVYQASLGLQHAHEEGLVHRDMKPGNLMLSRSGNKATIKILDFGLAKASREQKIDGTLTHEGQALGTPDFIAPEQIVNAPNVDIRADIYSLGGTLYYLLTGHAPFEANSLYDVYQAHMSRDADSLNLIRHEVPVELAALVAKMMAKEPRRRFQTPGDVAHALTPFLKRGSVAFKGAGPAAPRSAPASMEQTDRTPDSGPAKPAPPLREVGAPAKSATAPTDEGGRWGSLTEIGAEEPLVNLAKPAPLDAKPDPTVAPDRRQRFIRLAILAGSLLGALALGVTIYVATDYGRIKIVVEGPHPTLVIDGKTVRIEGLHKPIVLDVGEHEFTVQWHDAQFKTAKFEVHRGNNLLRIEYEPKISAGHERNGVPELPAAIRTVGSSHDHVESREPTQASSADAFIQLFNGTDRTGWKTHPLRPGNWRVENGLLIGSGPEVGNLYSERGDYKDFQLRVEVRNSGGRNSGVFFRHPFGGNWSEGYEAQIWEPGSFGTLHAYGKPAPHRTTFELPEDEWFWLEIEAEGMNVVTKVNGQIVTDYTDEDHGLDQGHIALELTDPQSVVKFRKIEIRELHSLAPALATRRPESSRGRMKAAQRTGAQTETNDALQP